MSSCQSELTDGLESPQSMGEPGLLPPEPHVPLPSRMAALFMGHELGQLRPEQRNQKIEMEVQGQVLKVKGFRPTQDQVGGGRRGAVTEFSYASRRRCLEMMARFNLGKSRDGHVATFVTLTTLAILEPMIAKRYLQTWLKRVRRRFPGASAVWRMEFQDRGAPHFHLIFFDLPYWHKTELQDSWGAVVGEDRPFTRIESIRSYRGVMSYCSKYVAKASREGGFNVDAYLTAGKRIGRFWGIFNREKLPFADLIRSAVTYEPDRYRHLVNTCRLFWPNIQTYTDKDTGELFEYDSSTGFVLYLREAYQLYSALSAWLVGGE